MSRIGKLPITVPKGVKILLEKGQVNIDGPKGKLTFNLHPRIQGNLKDGILTFTSAANSKSDGALQGTTRSIVASMVQGVTEGFSKELLIEGVGFKAQLQGKKLNLALGFTHPVLFDVPEGLTVEVPKPTQIIIKGTDKMRVGDFAAKIRKTYKAEPYKGKGIRYAGEVVRRKAGKTVTK